MSKCGNSGNLGASGTLGAVCVELHASVPDGWNVSNAGPIGASPGCTITLTGGGKTQMAMGNGQPMPVGADGYVYWNLTAGCINYVAIACF
jgi:hypothetical protein